MNSGVTVKTKKLKRTLTYKDCAVLKYEIEYPKFFCGKTKKAYKIINNFFFKQANALANYCERELICDAISEFKQRKKDKTPFQPYQVMLDYTVTYSSDCVVSLFLQKYKYTGGAHGNMKQYAFSYSLDTQEEIELKSLYPKCVDYKKVIKENIKKTIAHEMKQGKGIFFDDYDKLVDKKFDKCNFYFAQKGLHIFFNEYDIAPYVAGIPTFLLPYSFKGPFAPTVL